MGSTPVPSTSCPHHIKVQYARFSAWSSGFESPCGRSPYARVVGIGRHSGFKIRRSSAGVRVRVPLRALYRNCYRGKATVLQAVQGWVRLPLPVLLLPISSSGIGHQTFNLNTGVRFPVWALGYADLAIVGKQGFHKPSEMGSTPVIGTKGSLLLKVRDMLE